MDDNTGGKGAVALSEFADLDTDLQPFQPIEIEDARVLHALKVAKKARDDQVRREQIQQFVRKHGIATVVASVAWYLVIGKVALIGGTVAASMVAAYTVAVIGSILWGAFRREESLDLRSQNVPHQLQKWRSKDWFSLALLAGCGPALYGWKLVDLIRRRHTESLISVEEPSQKAVSYSASEILADVRVSRVLLPLEFHLQQWKMAIVRPNRWIATIVAGITTRDDVDMEHLERMRTYRECIEKLEKLASLLLVVEGPLGNAESRDRGEEDILDQVEQLIESLNTQLRNVGGDPAQLQANAEVRRMTAKDPPKVQYPDFAQPAPKDDS